MSRGSKILFLLVVCVVVQTITAWPFFSPFRQKNLQRDIERTITKLERDTAKDAADARNKILKESRKLTKKATPEAHECVNEQQATSLSELEEASGNGGDCLESVRSEAHFDPEEVTTMREYMEIRNKVKDQAKDCRSQSKDAYKKILDEFGSGAKACLRA